MKILLIDDDEGFQQIFRLKFKNNNVEIDTCTDPFMSMNILSKKTFDLILIDYQMPGCTGDEIAKMISTKTNAEIWIISNYKKSFLDEKIVDFNYKFINKSDLIDSEECEMLYGQH